MLTIRAIEANTSVNKVGGRVGVATTAFAFYASGAGVINDTFKKPLLPVFPLAKG